MIENVDERELKKLIKALVHQQFFIGHDTIVDRMKHTEQRINGSGAIIDEFINTLYTFFIRSDDYAEIIKTINEKFDLEIDEKTIKENIELASEDGQSGIDLAMFPLADTISAFREKAYDRCEEIIYDYVKDLFSSEDTFKRSLRLMFQKNDENLSLFLNIVVFDNMVQGLETCSPDLEGVIEELLSKIKRNFIANQNQQSQQAGGPVRVRRRVRRTRKAKKG